MQLTSQHLSSLGLSTRLSRMGISKVTARGDWEASNQVKMNAWHTGNKKQTFCLPSLRTGPSEPGLTQDPKGLCSPREPK